MSAVIYLLNYFKGNNISFNIDKTCKSLHTEMKILIGHFSKNLRFIKSI